MTQSTPCATTLPGPQLRDLWEPLNKSTRSAFQSETPQIVRCDASDSSHSYGRVAQRARCGVSGETHTGRAFAGHPARFSSLIWNDQTALAEATLADPAKTCRARADLFRGSPDQITELAAHIYAANYRLLSLIREFDEAAGWSGPGLRSCAHWLNWKCGISLGGAREGAGCACSG